MNMRHTGAVAGLDADVPYVTEDAAEFRVSIDAYRRADIFEREIKAIFNSNWIYLGHESELPNKGDFKATWIGRQSVIVARDTDGTINAFLNFCRHRGAGLVRQEKGNVRTFNCPYHGWSWKLNGELAGVTDSTRFPEGFAANDKGLIKVARLAQYGGLIFGSLNKDVEDFETYLGEAKQHIDLWLGRCAGSKYRVATAHKYAYRGNWKFQAENVYDGYHANFVHRSAYNTFRKFEGQFTGRHYNAAVRTVGQTRGYPTGHGVLEAGTPLDNKFVDPDIKQRYLDRLLELNGKEKTDAILENRHLLLWPSVVIMDSNIRVIQPLAHDYTEIYSYPMIIEGVDDQINYGRLHDVQTRVGPAGLVGADDLDVFHSAQTAQQGSGAEWITLSRGLHLETSSPSGERVGAFTDETPQRAFWRKWHAVMTAAAGQDSQ